MWEGTNTIALIAFHVACLINAWQADKARGWGSHGS